MKKVDWKRKLASRKFWLAVIGFITPILIALKADTGTIEQVASIIMSGASLIAYVLAEGFVDGKNVEKENDNNE